MGLKPPSSRTATSLLALFVAGLVAATPASAREQKLMPPDKGGKDEFGYSVAIDGKFAVVGAPNATTTKNRKDANTGAAYLFQRKGDGWDLEAKLVPANDRGTDRFGTAVAISGSKIAVSAPKWNSGEGAIYLYSTDGKGKERDEITRLKAFDGQEADARRHQRGTRLGTSLAMQGSTIVAGAPGQDNGTSTDEGAVYAFDFEEKRAFFKGLAGPGQAYDFLGSSVDVDGSKIVAGAPGADRSGGRLYTFSSRNEGIHDQRNVLSPNVDRRSLGLSVAIDGSTVVGGAPDTGVEGKRDAGAALVFPSSGDGQLAQTSKLISSTPAEDARIGRSVAIGDSMILVGSESVDGGRGALLSYPLKGMDDRTETKVFARGGAGEGLGFSVAIDGDLVISGSPQDRGRGSATVFSK